MEHPYCSLTLSVGLVTTWSCRRLWPRRANGGLTATRRSWASHRLPHAGPAWPGLVRGGADALPLFAPWIRIRDAVAQEFAGRAGSIHVVDRLGDSGFGVGIYRASA